MSVNPLLQYFAQVPVLAALPDESQKRLERIAEQRHYRRRQVVHFADQAGDFLFLLCTGRVKVSRVSEQGREVTLYLIEGNQVFGETGLIAENQPYELMAETLEDSLIAVFRRSDIITALNETPQAAGEMLKLVSERRSTAETAVADLVFLDVPKRLAKLLLKLHDAHGTKTGRAGTLIKAKFTHQELANMIGSTRETTTLILNDFKRQGYIDFTGRKIVVRSRKELDDIFHGPSRGAAAAAAAAAAA
jgi:CRP/FNR family cyclic AMP-dependent transcriptional regulator